MRVGYLVVPSSLWQRFVEAREAFDLFPPTLYQRVLAEFLHEGHFVRHLRRMRGVYRLRREALLNGLRRHCGNRVTVYNADAGLHMAVLLSAGEDTHVVRRMARRGLTATPLSTCYVGKPGGMGCCSDSAGPPSGACWTPRACWRKSYGNAEGVALDRSTPSNAAILSNRSFAAWSESTTTF